MRLVARNKRTFYYSLYEGRSDYLDDNGERMPKYSEAIPMSANISAAYGSAETEQFGTMLDYDRVIITDDVNCPIDEQSVLFVDKEPEFDEIHSPLGDYIVKRVAKSFNNISYAIKKVDMS